MPVLASNNEVKKTTTTPNQNGHPLPKPVRFYARDKSLNTGYIDMEHASIWNFYHSEPQLLHKCTTMNEIRTRLKPYFHFRNNVLIWHKPMFDIMAWNKVAHMMGHFSNAQNIYGYIPTQRQLVTEADLNSAGDKAVSDNEDQPLNPCRNHPRSICWQETPDGIRVRPQPASIPAPVEMCPIFAGDDEVYPPFVSKLLETFSSDKDRDEFIAKFPPASFVNVSRCDKRHDLHCCAKHDVHALDCKNDPDMPAKPTDDTSAIYGAWKSLHHDIRYVDDSRRAVPLPYKACRHCDKQHKLVPNRAMTSHIPCCPKRCWETYLAGKTNDCITTLSESPVPGKNYYAVELEDSDIKEPLIIEYPGTIDFRIRRNAFVVATFDNRSCENAIWWPQDELKLPRKDIVPGNGVARPEFATPIWDDEGNCLPAAWGTDF